MTVPTCRPTGGCNYENVSSYIFIYKLADAYQQLLGNCADESKQLIEFVSETKITLAAMARTPDAVVAYMLGRQSSCYGISGPGMPITRLPEIISIDSVSAILSRQPKPLLPPQQPQAQEQAQIASVDKNQKNLFNMHEGPRKVTYNWYCSSCGATSQRHSNVQVDACTPTDIVREMILYAHRRESSSCEDPQIEIR